MPFYEVMNSLKGDETSTFHNYPYHRAQGLHNPLLPKTHSPAIELSRAFCFLHQASFIEPKMVALVGQSTEWKEVVVAVTGTVDGSPSTGSCRPTK
jgi:hypothetical protein